MAEVKRKLVPAYLKNKNKPRSLHAYASLFPKEERAKNYHGFLCLQLQAKEPATHLRCHPFLCLEEVLLWLCHMKFLQLQPITGIYLGNLNTFSVLVGDLDF